MRAFHGALALTALALGACDTDQSFLFQAAIDGVPAVLDLGVIEPIDPNVDTISENVYYGEVGPTGSAAFGGITAQFVGDGGDVCVWVDPEAVSWSQSISIANPIEAYSWPDNLFDDGDLDLYAGLSVFYSGVIGEEIGSFQVPYRDELGNTVPIEFVECTNASQIPGVNANAFSGRGTPEFCTIGNTVPGAQYTVAMQTYSLPTDDARLSFGVVLARGSCEQLAAAAGGLIQVPTTECLIPGESLDPSAPAGQVEGLEGRVWFGEDKPTWEFYEEFEQAFCDRDLAEWCADEARRKANEGATCSWPLQPTTEAELSRCFCGNILDTPSGGAL